MSAPTEKNDAEILRQLREHWQKIALYAMIQMKVKHLTFDEAFFKSMGDKIPIMITEGLPDGFRLSVFDTEEEALAYAAQQQKMAVKIPTK